MELDLSMLFKNGLFYIPKKMEIAGLALKLNRVFEWHNTSEEKPLKKFYELTNMEEKAEYEFTEVIQTNVLCAAASAKEGVDIMAMFSMLYSEPNPMLPCPLTAACIFNEIQNQCCKKFVLFDRQMDNIDYLGLFEQRDGLECHKMCVRIDETISQFCSSLMLDLSAQFTPRLEFQQASWDSCNEQGGRKWEGLFIIPDINSLNEYTQVLCMCLCLTKIFVCIYV